MIARRRVRPRVRSLVGAIALVLVAYAPLEAQLEEVAGGAGGAVYGAATGLYVTTAIFVAKARAGSFLYSMGDVARLRWEITPALLGPLAGGALGATSPDRLAPTVLWGLGGLAVGTGVGLAAGHLLGDSSEARWAGAIVGSAAGLLVGSVIGAMGGQEGESGVVLDIRLPVSIGGAR